MSPALNIVPGKPTALINQKPLANTPIAAPMLLLKYSIAMLPPGVSGNLRTMPALISGKVMPSRIDCGMIIRLAANHFSVAPRTGVPIDGRTEA